jgi:hypothetical protein
MLLESSRQGLQLWFGPHPNQRSAPEVIVPTFVILGLPFRSLGTKSHLDATLAKWCRVYYMGESGGFPRVRAVVSLMSPRSPVARPNTKRAPT